MNFISFKMQAVCLILLIYLVYLYVHSHSKEDKTRSAIYAAMLVMASVYLPLDMITVYTVNHAGTVAPALNQALHMLFLISILSFLMLTFLYISRLCQLSLSSWAVKAAAFLPYLTALVFMIANMGDLEYRTGRYTSYSMGKSVYACYAVGFLYFVVSVAVFLKRMQYIPKHKQKILLASNGIILATMTAQLVFPEILATSFPVVLILLSYYMSIENGSYENSRSQQKDMVHGLADIVESRDESTGGHIKRTSVYVALLAGKLRTHPQYRYILTQDYIDALLMAAPLHDIGKIAIPDSILQKAGKLTEEEYSIMKTHTTTGAELVKRSLAIDSSLCRKIIYETVYYHHEKWNGKGYPAGKNGEGIPLCARLIAVVDVFDAVSQDRCYREAMSLDQSFAIIEKGCGTDFDPVIARCFLDNRTEIEKMYSHDGGM